MAYNVGNKNVVVSAKCSGETLLVANRACHHLESNSLAYWLQEVGWKRIQLMLLSIYGDYGEETCWVTAVVYV